MKKTLFLTAILGAAFCSTAFGARTVADYSTTDGEMEFSGAIIEYTGTSNNQTIGTSGVTFDINKSGTTYQKKGASQNPDLGGTNGNLWEYLTTHKDNVVYGHTIKMSGSTGGEVQLNTSGMGNTLFGGLITTAEAANASYTLNANSGDAFLTANDEVGANMSIGANTTFKAPDNNTIEIASSGTWDIADGKTLLLRAGRIYLHDNTTVSLNGGGTLAFEIPHSAHKLQLGEGAQFDINGGTTVQVGDSFNYAFSDGAGFTSSDNTGKLNFVVTATNVGPEAGTNAFGTQTYTTTGSFNAAEGVTLLLNGREATLSDKELTANGTTYFIQNASATWDAAGATDIVVDTETTDTAVALGGGVYTLNSLTVESGKVTTTHSGDAGCVSGTITVKGGAVFEVAGQHDAFGYNSGVSTEKVVLDGTNGETATLALNQTTGNTVTMRTALEMKGNAAVTGKGFNTFDGFRLTVSGTNNVIDKFDMRKNATVDVAANGSVEMKSVIINAQDTGDDRTLDKTGSGDLIISGDAALKKVHHVGGAIKVTAGTTNILALEGGDGSSGSTTIDVAAGATLAITGANGATDTSYKNKGLILSEWNAGTTANIDGALLSEDATAYIGDATLTLNLNSGSTTALAGIAIANTKGNKEQGLNLNMAEGSTFILGAAGITTTKNTNVQIAGGELGISADEVAIATDMTVTGALTINTNKYTFNANGTAVTAGTDGGTLTMNGNINLNGGSLTVTGNGTFTMKSLQLTGDDADLTIDDTTTVTDAADLAVNALTMKAGATLSIGQHEDSIVSVQTLTVEGDSTLNANLAIAEEGALISHGVLSMGCTVTIGSGTEITVDGDIAAGPVTIFTDVDSLTLGNVDINNATWTDAVGFVINGVTASAGEYVIGYWDGTVSIAAANVPEPATATLSLLALAALAARRRRH